MNEQPYMPLFFGDVLKQTLFWTGEERALYVLLLSVQWYNGPLPCDQAMLAHALGYDEQKFCELWSNVHQQFVQTERGFLNESLEEHREYLAHRAATLSAAGRKGGQHTQAKAREVKQADSKADDQANGEAPTEASSQAKRQATRKAGFKGGFKAGLKAGSSIPTQSNPIQSKAEEEEPEPLLSDPPPLQNSASVHLPPPGVENRGGNGASPSPAAPAPADENGTKPRATRRMPKDFDAEPLREWALVNAPGVNFDEEVAKMRDHQFRTAHSDWPAVVRNWLRRERDERKRRAPASTEAAPTRFEQHKRRLYGA